MMKFKPSQDQIRLAEAVMTTMSHEALIRPIVEGYEKAILEKHQFHIDRAWLDHGCEDKVILDRKESFLLSEEDAKVFYSECFSARDAARLAVDKPENCPLLVAENLRVQAENALLEAMATTPGFETLGSAVLTLEQRAKAIDLTLKLLAPFFSDAKTILERYCVEGAGQFRLPGVWEEVEPRLFVRSYNDGVAFIEANVGTDTVRFTAKTHGALCGVINAVQQVGEVVADKNDQAAIDKAVLDMETVLAAELSRPAQS